MKTSQCTNNKRIALFQGSFDPFTRGHESIVKRALSTFDEVVVAVVNNSQKSYMFTKEMRMEIIKSTFRNEPRVKVVYGNGLTIDVAKEVGACCLLRGVRSIQDFEYEMGNAEANRRFGGIETLLMYTLPEMSHISSTMVREWLKYGKDMTSYLPEGIDKELLNTINKNEK